LTCSDRLTTLGSTAAQEAGMSSMSVPHPSTDGIAGALEEADLRVTDDARAELDRLTARVDPDTVDSSAVITLFEAIRDTAEGEGLGIVDGNVMRLTVRRLCPSPPWC
jgi:hypothetical protein